MSGNVTVWIVNPDEALSQRWERLLREQGWSVGLSADLPGFLAAAARASTICLLDLACLAGPSRPRSLEDVRRRAETASFLLTAGPRLEDDEVVELLEAGADDFFPHAMAPELLLAKLKAHLRRVLPAIAQSLEVHRGPGKDIKLDEGKRELWLRKADGKWIRETDLTGTEIRLLSLFLERPGTALERRFIIDALRPANGEAIRPGTVDKHVESLRRKLGRFGSRIKTVYGVGYVYREKRP